MTEAQWLASSDPAAMLAVVTRDRRSEPAEATRMASDRQLRLFAVAASRAIGMPTDTRLAAVEAWADGGPEPESDSFSYESRDPYTAAERVTAEAYALAFIGDASRQTADWAQSLKAALLREIVGNPFAPVVLPKGKERCPRCINERWPGWIGGDSLADAFAIELAERCCKTCNPVWHKESPTAGWIDGPCPWITPQVLSLARAAYDERGRKCRCRRPWSGLWGDLETGRLAPHGQDSFTVARRCPGCRETGTVADGTLDNFRLALLADALEEAGCVETSEEAVTRMYVCEKCGNVNDLNNQVGICCRKCGSEFCRKQRLRDLPHPIISHLRSPGPHVRGCWATDLVLGYQ